MAEIELTRGRVAQIDDADYSLVSAYRWYADPNGHGGWNAKTMRCMSSWVILLALVAGCAHAPLVVPRWSKDGVSYEEFLQDRYACIQSSRVGVSPAAYGQGRNGEIVSLNLYKPCMTAKGYRVDPEGFAVPPGREVMLAP